MTVTVRSIIATAAVAIMAAVILLTAGTSGTTPETPQRAHYTGDLTSEAGTPIGTDDRMLNGAGSHGASVVTNDEGLAIVTDSGTIVVAWDATEDCTVLPASARSDRCELLTDY